jgi:hypothetical protein
MKLRIMEFTEVHLINYTSSQTYEIIRDSPPIVLDEEWVGVVFRVYKVAGQFNEVSEYRVHAKTVVLNICEKCPWGKKFYYLHRGRPCLCFSTKGIPKNFLKENKHFQVFKKKKGGIRFGNPITTEGDYPVLTCSP